MSWLDDNVPLLRSYEMSQLLIKAVTGAATGRAAAPHIAKLLGPDAAGASAPFEDRGPALPAPEAVARPVKPPRFRQRMTQPR